MRLIANLSKCICAFLLFCFAISCADRSNEMTWKAGTAKTIITPETPVWLAGYGWKRESDGVLHDLWVKALALEDRTGHRAVVVTSDLMGIPRCMYESICQKLMKRFHLDRSQVLLTFTHNHCGPRLREDLVDYYPDETAQNELVREYSDTVEAKIIETVAQAFSDLSPARLSIGEGTASFAVNRRNNIESDVPELLAAGTPLKGPVDHSVPVMAVHKAKDRLVAILFGYACHPTTLRFEKWCGDYPGFAQIALEKNHPGAMALFFTGCGGDQNPLPRKEVSLCKQYGNRLAEAVEKTLQRRLKPIPSELRTAFEFVDLDYLKSPTRKELEDAFHDTKQEMSARIRARWAERMLNKMDAGERFAASCPYPVQVWKLGGILHWISLGGEAVVDYSLHFKKEFGPNTWVCGYANALVAYIPSLRVYKEGGYEGGAFLYEYGHPAKRWAGDVEERVVGAVNRLVRKVAVNPINVVDFKIELDVVLKHDDGDYIWFHPRVAAIPCAESDGSPTVIMTLQKHLQADDHYSGLSVMRTDDLGTSWSGPVAPPELDWQKVSEQVTVSIANVTPGWHAPTQKLLAIGAQVWYDPEGHILRDKMNSTAYAVHDPGKGTWSKWQVLAMPPDEKFNYCLSSCAQWLAEPDSTLLLPFSFGKNSKEPMSVLVARCKFDGQRLTYVRHGNTLSLNVERGLCEPSLIKFSNKYYLTIRNDLKGYVTVSDDGLHFRPIKEWRFDDGTDLGNYNTQQHWLAHSNGLFLVYTRRGANNDHIMRHRAPLFIAQVDPEELCVIRKTERVLIPEQGAPMGNFGAAAITETESWVTVSEFMWPSWNVEARKRGAAGRTFIARVIWSNPNRARNASISATRPE